MCGWYVYKAKSDQSAPPIQSRLDDVQYGECNTGKLLHSTSTREYYVLAEYKVDNNCYYASGTRPSNFDLSTF